MSFSTLAISLFNVLGLRDDFCFAGLVEDDLWLGAERGVDTRAERC
jgi:hypothetical protein